jgi:ATP-dependent Clp protease protease subunit
MMAAMSGQGWFGRRLTRAKDTDDALLARRIVVLRGMLDDTAASHVIAKLLYLQDQDPSAPIRLHIDSPGGGVSSSLAIRDTIETLAPDVYTHCLAEAHGAAAVVLAHGARGHRSAVALAQLSLTRLEWTAAATPDDIATTERTLVAMLAADTGQTSQTIADDMRTSRQFDAVTAALYGLIDRVDDDAAAR